MTSQQFPNLDPESITVTREALHAYARVFGGWTSAFRSKRKHWWHASLRPSLYGLTTGVIHADISFELELNLREGFLQARTSIGEQWKAELHGQPPAELAAGIREFLIASGIDMRLVPEEDKHSENGFDGYSGERARDLARAVDAITAAMESFRAGIREEASPIQLWPHHFDLSMLWLPGDKVSGQELDDEESADKQMNFGFTFGDDEIPEPYFYVTAYPLPNSFPSLRMPAWWHSGAFSGAVVLYRSLVQEDDPNGYLVNLWNVLLSAGREHMLVNTT